jgi:PHD/YefM family antitoxin component YafN of YafNO toxin-antitoxin module
MIILMNGHAMAGCWLDNETFSDCLEYDAAAVTKRIAHGIDAISAVECTGFTAGKNVDFDDAEKKAAEALADAASFVFAIDIARTRSGGIRPMPSRISEGDSFKAVDYGGRKDSEITAAPSELEIIGDTALVDDREVTKQVIWERKLLDLSLRNSLLNFRPNTMSVQLLTSDLGVLEDEMSKDTEFKVMPVPDDMVLKVSDSKIYEAENGKDQITSIAESEFKSNRLRTYLKEADLEKIMKKLHRQAKVSIEENQDGSRTITINN